jgi:drug/metabolite transporter (DMT)-like permease
MVSTYLLMILLIISFTINPFLKKQASQNVTASEFALIYQSLAIIFVLFYLVYLIKGKSCSIYCFRKMSRNDLFWTIMAVITGLIGSVLLLFLIKRDEVSYLIPNVQGIVILLGALIGYFIYKESFDKFKIFGILLVFLGIVSINYGKLTSS